MNDAANKLPAVAIVGRPNVGKSALFNRLIRRKVAIVHDRPGITRDRISAVCASGTRPFVLWDTGGIFGAGEAKPDHLGIGLEVSDECRAGQRLWALGPLTKGRYWEIIAVPDIREQAAAVADDIAKELS